MLSGCTHEPSKNAISSTPPATPVHLAMAEIHRMEADLASGDVNRVREALELPAGRRLAPHFVQQLHDLTISLEPSTAVAIGRGQVAVNARVTSSEGRAMTWRVTLDKLHGTYVVANTQQVQR
jgi:hypothetical protein